MENQESNMSNHAKRHLPAVEAPPTVVTANPKKPKPAEEDLSQWMKTPEKSATDRATMEAFAQSIGAKTKCNNNKPPGADDEDYFDLKPEIVLPRLRKAVAETNANDPHKPAFTKKGIEEFWGSKPTTMYVVGEDGEIESHDEDPDNSLSDE